MDASVSQAETGEVALRYNVTGTRIVAALIDIAVIAAVFVMMALAWGDVGKSGNDGSSSFHVYLTGGPFLLFLVATFAYFVLFEGLLGATLGKIAAGLRVVDVDGSGCSWPAAFIRNVLRFIDALPVFYLVGLIAVAVNEKKQRLGDLAAKTLVVRARQ
jgi:uncharacterized RDD family membrane protein YckC